jgi:uncharacterized membrane protein YphA (DoxX/SURF4 family)
MSGAGHISGPLGTNWKRTCLNVTGVLLRWALGGYFIYMGYKKGLHPEDFLKLVRQYDLVNQYLILNSIAAALPWFEVFCGLLLLTGIAVRGAALNLIAMLVPFTIIVTKRALTIAAADGIPFSTVRFDCGCGAGEVLITHKLIENTLLFLLACCLVAGWGKGLALKFDLLRSRLGRPLANPGHPEEIAESIPSASASGPTVRKGR